MSAPDLTAAIARHLESAGWHDAADYVRGDYITGKVSDLMPPDLSDPAVVHANMLRGTIAKLTVDQVKHLYPDLCASGQVRGLMEAADRDADRCAGQIAELEAALEKARAEAAPDERSADMAECFMFSVGYEAGESDGRAAAIKQAGIQRENGDHNQAPLDQAQQPAAEVGPDPMCPDCKGTGERDSSGTHPWGAPAMAPCDCDKSRVSVADHPDFARVGDSLYDAGYKAGWNAALKDGDENV